jgi:enoyl-CoA hydratase/carnithine racemase
LAYGNEIHMTSVVRYTQSGDVAHLTLNRPQKGNALASDIVDALDLALDQAIADGARLIVFRGEGRHFCTGFDLSRLEQETDADLAHRFLRIELLLQKIAIAPLMTVCWAQGRITGAGADIFAVCDVRLCPPDAKFAFPGAGFGVVLGTRRLSLRVGAVLAGELVFSGREISAERAERSGLATDIVSAEDLDALIKAFEERVARVDVTTAGILLKQTRSREGLDGDLAELARSVARPGLKTRILEHRAKVLAGRAAQL